MNILLVKSLSRSHPVKLCICIVQAFSSKENIRYCDWRLGDCYWTLKIKMLLLLNCIYIGNSIIVFVFSKIKFFFYNAPFISFYLINIIRHKFHFRCISVTLEMFKMNLTVQCSIFWLEFCWARGKSRVNHCPWMSENWTETIFKVSHFKYLFSPQGEPIECKVLKPKKITDFEQKCSNKQLHSKWVDCIQALMKIILRKAL